MRTRLGLLAVRRVKCHRTQQLCVSISLMTVFGLAALVNRGAVLGAALFTLVSFITIGFIWTTVSKKLRWLQVSTPVLPHSVWLNTFVKTVLWFSQLSWHGHQLCLYIYADDFPVSGHRVNDWRRCSLQREQQEYFMYVGSLFSLEFGLPVRWKNSSRPGVKIYLAYNLTGSTTWTERVHK